MQTDSTPFMRPLLWRNSHFNRHGLVEATLLLVLMQILTNLGSAYFNLTLHPEKFIESTEADEQFGMFILVASLFVAPWLENIVMLLLAEIHELNFQRTGLFIVTPLIFALLHVFPGTHVRINIYVKFVTTYIAFYIFLKQYDLHKLEIGRPKALLLSSVIHFLANLAGHITIFVYAFCIDAESIFSA